MLQEIKKKYLIDTDQKIVVGRLDEIKWLIQQAERAEDFEIRNNELIEKQIKYKQVLTEVDSIIVEATKSIEASEPVNGLEWARKLIKEL